MRRRIACLRDSGNLAWSIAAAFISLIAIAPVLAIIVLAAHSSGDSWPHLVAQCASQRHAAYAVIDGGRRRANPADRHWHCSICHDVPLCGAKSVSVASPAAARHPDLHHRLLLSRAVRLFRRAANRAPRHIRLAKRQGLLVSRSPHCRRRHLRHEHWCSILTSTSPRGRASLCNRCAWSK